MLTLLIYLQQANVEESKKLMKIVNTDKKPFKSSEHLEEFKCNIQEKCVLW